MTTKTVQSGMWNNANNTHQVIVIHDTESSTARAALSWMQSQQNGSYQDLVDLDGTVFLMVPENKQAWAAMGTGNRIGLHVCATGYAKWSRSQWLRHPDMLASIAAIIADWSRKYGIPLTKISPQAVAAGKKGVCGHGDISAAFRESDHTDPGNNFPFDAVLKVAESMDSAQVNFYKSAYMYPVGTDVKEIREQMLGPNNDGWPQLAGHTLTDGIAAVLNAIEQEAH